MHFLWELLLAKQPVEGKKTFGQCPLGCQLLGFSLQPGQVPGPQLKAALAVAEAGTSVGTFSKHSIYPQTFTLYISLNFGFFTATLLWILYFVLVPV